MHWLSSSYCCLVRDKNKVVLNIATPLYNTFINYRPWARVDNGVLSMVPSKQPVRFVPVYKSVDYLRLISWNTTFQKCLDLGHFMLENVGSKAWSSHSISVNDHPIWVEFILV